MANPGVAEGALPEGSVVLSPNANENEASQATGLEQFGTELGRPNAASSPAVEVDKDGKPIDPTLRGRYEYHQSRADKAETDLVEARRLLAEKAKNDPLIDLIKTDNETFQFVQSRLSGNRAPAKPLEPPQKPDSYNEVEAFSNPESTSFKYRKELDGYKDKVMIDLQNQNRALFQARQQDEEEVQKRVAADQQMKKFRSEVTSKGIADEEFMDFFQLVNTASVDDMVEYFQFRKGRTSPQPAHQFGGLPRTSVSSPGSKRGSQSSDIGKEILLESRTL